MKIITFSDLHLEFGIDFTLPENTSADLMILAGDIISFRDYNPLSRLLEGWSKPVIFVAGNHEFYTHTNMHTEAEKFQQWLSKAHPNVHFLQNQPITIDGVHFFGGTMWTDFLGGSEKAMVEAMLRMNDFRYIKMRDNISITPHYNTILHDQFVEKLMDWLQSPMRGKRVVITHHAPVINPLTKHKGSLLEPAFNSTDMINIIDQYQPNLWIYGHTHECDDHYRGKTRIISNQSGYQFHGHRYECKNSFDPLGKPININE